MQLTMYQADAFTDHVFGGNPAAICPLDSWLPDDIMQAIAQENNLAETAYFAKEGDAYRLRWFTPAAEVDLCGHATLASAHIMFTELGYAEEEIHFMTRSGKLIVKKSGDNYAMDFPSQMPKEKDSPHPLLVESMGKAPKEIMIGPDYFLVYENQAEIESLKPNFNLMMQVDDCRGIIATAPGDHSDFVSRFFAPRFGINEDPVTGSAHCALIPYWAQKLGKNDLHAYQISSRKGELFCQYNGDRVVIAGKAVSYLKGEISISV